MFMGAREITPEPRFDQESSTITLDDYVFRRVLPPLERLVRRFTTTPLHRRIARHIETRWQDQWDAEKTFEAPNPAGPLAEPDKVAGRPKLFVLDMFPYPSGAGLHVGHPLGYIGTDVYGRFQRMMGYNVLHALGYDSFGLPAEQHAITTGVHPRVNTEANVSNMRRQLRRLGLATTHVEV